MLPGSFELFQKYFSTVTNWPDPKNTKSVILPIYIGLKWG